MVDAYPILLSFPSLNLDEFRDACQALQRRCENYLDDTDWISVKWHDDELTVRKSCNATKSDSLIADTQHNGPEESADDVGIEFGEDEQTLARFRDSNHEDIVVDFSITLSPTYQVPVLWFIFQNLPQGGPSGIDAVYHYLVPKSKYAGLCEVGVIGGISMAHHPISDVPAFFIHPCNTADSMRELGFCRNQTPERYLLVWLGLVGSSVNLHIPSKLLQK